MPSCSVPVMSYAKFTERIYRKLIEKKIPFSGTIELTARCNLNCCHCYIHNHASKNELHFSEICRILDEITDKGCLRLLLTGGEPLTRKDFLDIYAYAKKKGLIIVLFTNATLVTTQIADFLRQYPPFLIEVSLYGITQETYEKVTGVSGSFERCMRGIHLLLEREIPLALKTSVITLNKDELRSIKRYASRLGVDFRYDPYINPAFDGSKEPCHFRLSPREAVNIEMQEEKVRNSWIKYHQRFRKRSSNPDKRLFTCGIGQFSFYISADGRLKACMMLEEPSYNLREYCFEESWHRLSNEVRSSVREEESKCARCKIISLCEQCPAWSILETGDKEKPVEYLCQVAHLRAKALEIN